MQQFCGFQGICRLACMGLLLIVSACSRSDPEQAVRAQLEALQQAIDARDAGAVEDLLAEDFIGNEGMDRRGAKQLAAGVFLRHREIGARLGPVTVELRGDHPEVDGDRIHRGEKCHRRQRPV